MFKKLFEPLNIKHVVIPNRAVVPAIVTLYCNEDGTASERFLTYHEEKAKGGWGLIITEDYAINPIGRGSARVPGLWNDEQMISHSELTRRVHKYESKIFAQIYHAGRQTSAEQIGKQPVAPSPIPCPVKDEMPRELTIDEIHDYVEQFGDSALRAKKAGFDGVEIHGGHGYLLAQFMSLYSNKRTDEYGGTLMNRLRIILEIIQNVREKVGSEFPVGFRLSGDEMVPGGRTIEDTKTIALILEQAGIDYISVSAGVYGSIQAVIPPAAIGHGWIVNYAAEVKRLVSIPVITVGRINDPLMADQILISGKADLTAMGRASLADPHLPSKALQGKLEDIRYCIGCNHGCAGLLYKDQAIRCTVNPTLGREYMFNNRADKTKKKVSIIGGGAAGMQAAINAAEFGHNVKIYEKAEVLGGQMRVAAVPPHKGEISGFINWQETQMKKLGVAIFKNCEATVDTIVIDNPDIVVIATGAEQIIPKIPGTDNKNVVLANDVLSGKAIVGPSVIIIGGGQVGAETANHLAVHGKKVTIIEMLPDIAINENYASRLFLMKELSEYGVQLLTSNKVKEITGTGVILDSNDKVINADTVVLALGAYSLDKFSESLKQKGLNVSVVGDANGVRQIMDAVTDGFNVAYNL